jgi:hypothetical protein
VVGGVGDAREFTVVIDVVVGVATVAAAVAAVAVLALHRSKVHVPMIKLVRVNKKTHCLLIFELQCV